MRSKFSILLILVVAFHSLVIPVANAYIDPGTGSYMVQLGLGGLLGLGLTLKLYWRRLMSLFSRHREGPKWQKSEI